MKRNNVTLLDMDECRPQRIRFPLALPTSLSLRPFNRDFFAGVTIFEIVMVSSRSSPARLAAVPVTGKYGVPTRSCLETFNA